MNKLLIAGLTALVLGQAASPALALDLLGTVRRVVDSNVSDPRDKPEVQAEVEHNDTSREEREHLDTSRQEREYLDTSRAEREYYDSFDR